eukprot:SAG11_NODE_3578_length_2358_cov_3.440018_3_plen_145_part_00
MFTRLRKELWQAELPPLRIPFMSATTTAADSPVVSGDVDFGSSFCVMNSPTLGTASMISIGLEAGCSLRPLDLSVETEAAAAQFWLTVPCIAENMYGDDSLVDLGEDGGGPAGEFSSAPCRGLTLATLYGQQAGPPPPPPQPFC